jgi:hypothetical protein
MTNFESCNQLLDDAKIYYEEMKRMFEKEKWHIIVRRAQEVVLERWTGDFLISLADDPAPYHRNDGQRAQAAVARYIKRTAKNSRMTLLVLCFFSHSLQTLNGCSVKFSYLAISLPA